MGTKNRLNRSRALIILLWLCGRSANTAPEDMLLPCRLVYDCFVVSLSDHDGLIISLIDVFLDRIVSGMNETHIVRLDRSLICRILMRVCICLAGKLLVADIAVDMLDHNRNADPALFRYRVMVLDMCHSFMISYDFIDPYMLMAGRGGRLFIRNIESRLYR